MELSDKCRKNVFAHCAHFTHIFGGSVSSSFRAAYNFPSGNAIAFWKILLFLNSLVCTAASRGTDAAFRFSDSRIIENTVSNKGKRTHHNDVSFREISTTTHDI